MSRRTLLWMTLAVEGVLLVAAIALMWFTGVRPGMASTPVDLALGLIGGGAMAAFAVTVTRLPLRLLGQLQRDIARVIALFGDTPMVDLIIISVMAGVCEEVFFRGFLQTWLEGPLGVHGAVLLASLVFGLMHAISPSYAVFAFLLGVALGYVYVLTGSLPAAMFAHAAYDLAALVYGTKVLARSRD